MHIYLDHDEQEKEIFQQAPAEITPETKEEAMELTASWMRKGIRQGVQIGEEQGQHKEALNLVARLLRQRFGEAATLQPQQLERLTQTQLEDLSEALLDFTSPAEVVEWLAQRP